ncbi:MAG: SAM-dependent methyltransferase, partial [Pseudomonadota bacterium]
MDLDPTKKNPDAGTLYVVATPIGNLDDLSTRAITVLGRVDVIAAEDTRVSQKLVPARTEPPRWFSLHDHNETRAIQPLIDRLLAGQHIALLSDAGTPLISDPGYRLVHAAHDHRIRVSPIPGPNAAMPALSAAG